MEQNKIHSSQLFRITLDSFVSSDELYKTSGRWYFKISANTNKKILEIYYQKKKIFIIDMISKRICLVNDEGLMRVRKCITDVSSIFPGYTWYGELYDYYVNYNEIYGEYDLYLQHGMEIKRNRKKKAKELAAIVKEEKKKKSDISFKIYCDTCGQFFMKFFHRFNKGKVDTFNEDGQFTIK